MPAIITHHIFGEKALAALPAGIVDGEEEKLAFLLGNQGPDPLFARILTSPSRGKVCRTLAHDMHSGRMTAALWSLHEGVAHLNAADKRTGRAFALGSLGHWLLDSVAHPFIYAQQYAVIAQDESLAGAGNEVHAVLESDIDSWLLWQVRGKTVEDCPPADELARTDRAVRIAGALISQTAYAIFDASVGVEEYGRAVADFETMYRLIEPAGSAENRALGKLEKLFRSHSRIEAQAHRVVRSDECPAANLAHAPWRDPWTGEIRSESFADLFVAAFERWDEAARIYVGGSRDELASFIDGVNYEGKRVADV